MQEKKRKKIDKIGKITTEGQITEEEMAGADMVEVKPEVMMRKTTAKEEEEDIDQEGEVIIAEEEEEEEDNEVPARRILLPLLWRSLWLGQGANQPNH